MKDFAVPVWLYTQAETAEEAEANVLSYQDMAYLGKLKPLTGMEPMVDRDTGVAYDAAEDEEG